MSAAAEQVALLKKFVCYQWDDRPHLHQHHVFAGTLAATDGHCIVWMPSGRLEPTTEHAEFATDQLAKVMKLPDVEARSVSGARLRHWSGEPHEPCECVGPSTCVCKDCGDVHDVACGECGDTKTVRTPKPGVLFGIPIDRRVVARALACMLVAPRVEVFIPPSQFDPIGFMAADVKALVMPTRYEGKNAVAFNEETP